jgi:hypothetical protein
MDNGFDTLEIFSEIDEGDLTTLGILQPEQRAKVLTAAELLLDSDCKLKFFFMHFLLIFWHYAVFKLLTAKPTYCWIQIVKMKILLLFFVCFCFPSDMFVLVPCGNLFLVYCNPLGANGKKSFVEPDFEMYIICAILTLMMSDFVFFYN